MRNWKWTLARFYKVWYGGGISKTAFYILPEELNDLVLICTRLDDQDFQKIFGAP